MIKKLFFITFILFLSIFISHLLNYNGEIILNLLNYQIITTASFLFFIITALFLAMYLIVYILVSLFCPGVNKYKKRAKKLQKQFHQYIELMTEGFIYRSVRNTKEAYNKLKKANKIFEVTNLSKLLESQIYYTEKKYSKSEESFREIKDKNLNLNLLHLKMNLEQSKRINKVEDIEKYAEQILKIEPVNKESLEELFKIYRNKKEWEKADKILQIALKSKVFDKDKMEKDILFLYASLGKKYYDSGKFFEAKTILRQAYAINRGYIQSTILLIETYIAIGKKIKAMEIIKKVWKLNPNPKIAELYFSLLKEKERKSIKSAETLYKLNPKNYESNLILAKAYKEAELYSKARKYAKAAENIAETKEVYELMLQIEQADNGSSAIIANLKNKILNTKNPHWKCSMCKREYQNWQPVCNNCGSLDSLEWTD